MLNWLIENGANFSVKSCTFFVCNVSDVSGNRSHTLDENAEMIVKKREGGGFSKKSLNVTGQQPTV